MSKYPTVIQKLIECFKKLPGVGSKTAERYAFQALDWSASEVSNFAESFTRLKAEITSCKDCNCYQDTSGCFFCKKAEGSKTLCIIAKAKDAYTMDRMSNFNGHFYVLGTLISPLEGKMPEDLRLEHLTKRIETLGIEEIIIALDSTLEGDATALYLHKHFKDHSLKVTKLALGLPMGSTLEYVDEGTLSQAFASRLTLA